MNRSKAIRAILALLLIIGAGATTYWMISRPQRRPPNIVLIVMDTARMDRLSLYGYFRETSPRLSALGDSATVYVNAWSTSSWTAPAHASLFTGLYPISHGTTQENWTLPGEITTLAEALAENGYATFGIAENPVLVGAERGYSRGFDWWHETWRVPEKRGVENEALRIFRETLDRVDREKPFFLFVNIVKPHSPYNQAKRFRGRFVSDPEIEVETNWALHYYIGKRSFTDAELGHLSEMYDEEILYTDFLVGEMIGGLVERGLWEGTAFVVTSDHGENFGEHGHVDHVFSLYETTTRIPLVLRRPGPSSPGDRVEEPVQIHDLFPTLLGLARIDRGRYRSEGIDLGRRTPEWDRPLFCEYYHPNFTLRGYQLDRDRDDPLLAPYKRRIRSVTVSGMKYIGGSDGKNELYDLAGDPEERVNLAGDPEHAATEKELATRLADYVEKRGGMEAARSPDAPDSATVEALRSLGYLE